MPGIEVQEVAHEQGRLIVLRQRVTERPNAGGKNPEVPGYKFPALRTNQPATVSSLEVSRPYNGRADIENRIKELGTPVRPEGPVLPLVLGHPGARHLATAPITFASGCSVVSANPSERS